MKNVFLLGLLSFLNDLTADMITPFLPVFLASMGLGAGFLGLMEGLANSLSNLTMLFSGRYADQHGNTKQITVLGYRISSFLRPWIAIPIPGMVFAVRLIDRMGKGIRTPPRDKLLTTSIEQAQWGQAFGIQRAFDHAGALLAAPLAVWLLSYSLQLSTLFLIASVPAVLSVLIVPRYLQDIRHVATKIQIRASWKELPLPLRRYFMIIFLSGLSTPSELFIILKMHKLGLRTLEVPIAWFILTLFTLIAAYLGGLLADRWSRRRTIAAGWLLFTLVYVGFAFNEDLRWSWVLVALYGIQLGIVEAPERMYPALIAHAETRATALGGYYFAYGLGLLPASLAFGLIWDYWGEKSAFLLNAALTAIAVTLLFFLPSDRVLGPTHGQKL